MDIHTLSPGDIAAILKRASVPEHSAAFMQVMSGGKVFCRGRYLFLTAEDWLMAIGYPLQDERTTGGVSEAQSGEASLVVDDFEAALAQALADTGARACWAIAPRLPARLEAFTENRDECYVLAVDAPVPGRLRGQVDRAAAVLRVTEDRAFTPTHRRLWAEFLGRVEMRSNVRELYARTEAVLAASRADAGRAAQGELPLLDLRLLSAWDSEDRLVSSLLLDYSPDAFCAYIIGAHSRLHYTPHATDLLFSVMLEKSRAEGKKFIHLGLGVNSGITRFKRKWGGRSVFPYAMAAWTEARQEKEYISRAGAASGSEVGEAMRNLLEQPAGLSKQQIFDTFPKQRDFAMIREVRKGAVCSYLCGTAHFFCYSFEMSFRKIFEPLHTIIFEGPLDEDFLAAVERVGRTPESGAPRLADALAEEDIQRLERVVYGPEGFWPRILDRQRDRIVDVRGLLAKTRPWFAFFSLWVAFLERQGWSQSVDLEAWATAKDMGKVLIGMENLQEQVASLEAVPFDRITDFLCRCREWPAYMKHNISTYLEGDLARMMGSSIEFPSRTEMVIEYRDTRFFERMLPFLEAGNCAVFVGTAHLVGLTPMLEKAGFTVKPAYTSLSMKLRAGIRDFLGKR